MVQTLLVYDDVITFLVYSHNDFIIGTVEQLDLSDADKVYLTVKEQLTDDDDDALLQFQTGSNGLLYVAKAEAANKDDGVLTKTDATLQVVLKGRSASLLAEYAGPACYFDIKKIVGENPIVVTTGRTVFKLVSTQTLT